jgi:hypothetical protein
VVEILVVAAIVYLSVQIKSAARTFMERVRSVVHLAESAPAATNARERQRPERVRRARSASSDDILERPTTSATEINNHG